MYLLENNVAWTTDLKNAFKNNITNAKIIYDVDREIDGTNNLASVELTDSRYVPNSGFIGQAVSKMLKITLQNDTEIINLENKDIVFKLGAKYGNDYYYINYGNFIVNDTPENDTTNGKASIVAYDYMIKFNQKYVDSITYPCTLLQLLQDVCFQAGVELGSLQFANYDFEVTDNQFEGKTLREVLQHIAKCAFSWARIGQDNKLYLDFIKQTPIVENISSSDYKYDALKRANEYYGEINRVTYGDSDIQGQEESVQDEESIQQYGVNELLINDNYFAYTTAKRQELIQAGTQVLGFKYMPISQMDLKGFAYLDCTDGISVTEPNGNIFTSRVFSHIITYNGILLDKVTTEATTKIEDSFRSAVLEEQSRTEVIVDRAKKQIQSIASQITDVSEQSTRVLQEVDALSATIVTKDEVESQIADLRASIEGLVLSTQKSGGDNIFYYAKEYWRGATENDRANLDEYTDTDIKQTSVSGLAYIMNNGVSIQSQTVENGFYTISFKYKKIINLATLSVNVNGTDYTLDADNLDTWYEKVIPIEVSSNIIEITFTADANSSFYVTDLMVALGAEQKVWTQNANETLTDTVKIGKGVQIESSSTNTYTRIDADGNRTFNRTTGQVVSEQTDKGTKTNELEVTGQAKINLLLVEKVDDQVWLVGIDN